MRTWNDKISAMSQSAKAATAIALLAIGAMGGASAASLTRPAIEMAPTIPTPVARLAAATGIVSVKGRVAEVYGDRFVIEDSSGRMMINAGNRNEAAIAKGATIGVQGRYEDGQLRASFITTANGQVEQVGPRGPHGRPGPDDRGPREHRPHDRPDAPPPSEKSGAGAEAPPAPEAAEAAIAAQTPEAR